METQWNTPYILRGLGHGHSNFPSYDRGQGSSKQKSYERNKRGYFLSHVTPLLPKL